MKIFFAILMLSFLSSYGCTDEKTNNLSDSNCATCENKEVIKVLKNEPATVRKNCFEHVGRVDTFYFELTTRYDDIQSTAIMPCNVIPAGYRVDGLAVAISGRITNCHVLGGCSDPNVKLTYINIFELSSIKK